jgi:hypothetical protein
MPLSNDPARRARQLENLRPAGAVSHSATSERKLQPLRAQHHAALLQRFPQLDEQRRSLLADLLARIDLAGEFIDVHGLMRNTRQPHPVLELLSRWERRAWEMLSALEAEHRAQREPHAEMVNPFDLAERRLDVPEAASSECGAFEAQSLSAALRRSRGVCHGVARSARDARTGCRWRLELEQSAFTSWRSPQASS